ncbi:MAG: hypothetical protein EAZ07_06580 [Cytophagales bacterium]|nr:MAG: hypothetical protein EAZ07_06580 [Cytophagales bacterium]
MKKLNLALILLLSFLFNACKKQIESPKWNVDVLAPIIKSSLSIKSLVEDSTYQLDKDSSVILVFKQQLDSFSLKGLNEFQIAPFYNKIKLSSLKLNTDTITQSITLGQIARQLLTNPDQNLRTVGIGILFSHGRNLDIPDFNNLTTEGVPFDVTEWFKYAIIKKGNLTISLLNQLPVTVSNIQFDLKNTTLEPLLVLSSNFSNVKPNETRTETVQLDNKKIEGSLQVNIADLDLLGGKNLLVDTNAALKLQVVITDIELEEADAIFPAQNVVVDTVEVPITLVAGVEAKKATLEKGLVRIKVLSTIQDSLFYTYKIPNAITPEGKPFVVNGKVPPSKGGVATQYEFIADFSGFKIDMRGAPGKDTVNAFYSDFTAAIRFSGKPVFLSLTKDSLEISITMEKLKPAYLFGFIQQDTLIEANTPVDIFNNISADAIDFKQINMKLNIKNSFGVTVEITPEYLKATGINGQTASLIDENLIGVLRAIPAASDNPLTGTSLELSTKNAAPLFNTIPKNVAYKLKIKTGKQLFVGGPKLYTDFAYTNSTIAPSITIEAPLNFSAKKLILQDTISLNDNFKNQIRNGKFIMLVKNGFPLKILIKLKFLDNNNKVLTTILPQEAISEGILNTNNKVAQASKSKINYNLSEETMSKINQANKILIEAQFDTAPPNTQIKIYHDYKIDLQLIGDINYQVN